MIEEQLQAEGELDSSGRFSLDPRLAAEKMSRYRLNDPLSYVLHLVASGVASGASQLSFRGGHGQLIFEHDGQAPTFAELTGLLDGLLVSPAPPPPLWELAIALQGARTLRPTITVECAQGHLTMTPRKLTVTPQLTIRRLSLSIFLHSLLKTDLPEFQLLSQRCLYCPIPVHLPEGLINRPFPHTSCWSQPDRIPWPLQQAAPQSRPAAPWGWAGGRYASPRTQGAQLEMVVHGVSYLQTPDQLPGDALVFSDTLSKDLSQGKIVENELYAQMLSDLSDPPGLAIS